MVDMHRVDGAWMPKTCLGVSDNLDTLREAFTFVSNYLIAIDDDAFIGISARFMSKYFETVYAISDEHYCLTRNVFTYRNVRPCKMTTVDELGLENVGFIKTSNPEDAKETILRNRPVVYLVGDPPEWLSGKEVATFGNDHVFIMI